MGVNWGKFGVSWGKNEKKGNLHWELINYTGKLKNW